MSQFNGQLNKNAIQNALFNMIISQEIIGGPLANNYNLVDKFRVDGGLIGDTKLYTDVPTLDSYEFVQDSEDALNLLKTYRPSAPKTQKIEMGVYRQVAITTDELLTKQAFMSDGVFTTYNDTLKGRLAQTKTKYDTNTFNSFFGTATGKVNQSVELDNTATGSEKNRNDAELIAQKIADIIADMKDYSDEYTTNGFTKAFNDSDIHVVWNVNYINKIRKVSLPNIYHNESLIDKFGEDTLPARYFGNINADQTTADGETIYSLIEQNIGTNHYAAGSIIKKGDVAPAGTSYTRDDSIICKIYTGTIIPYMSAFNVSTSFFNGKNLSTNSYLTFGHNKLAVRNDQALVTVRAK